MATRTTARRNEEQVLMSRWWIRALLAVTFLAVAYGFASLAIDSGSLWEYVITIAFIWWAVHHAIRAVRFAFSNQ